MDQKKSCTPLGSQPAKPLVAAISGARVPGSPPKKLTGGILVPRKTQVAPISKLNTVAEPIYCQVGSISPNIIYSLDTAAFYKCNS